MESTWLWLVELLIQIGFFWCLFKGIWIEIDERRAKGRRKENII